MWPSENTCRSNEKTQNGKQLITCVTSSSGQSIVYALISDKLHYSNPFWSVNFDRDSFKLHKVLHYHNWTDNKVKIECLRTPIRQKLNLKIVKLANMANFLVEFGSGPSSTSFIRPLKECELYTNINFYQILLKTHSLVKF